MEAHKEDLVVGVDMGGTKIGAGLVSGSQVIRRSVKAIDNTQSKEQILSELMGVIDELIQDDVCGIGVGVPSLVDVVTGTVRCVQNIPSWDEVPLADLLWERYQLPAYVNNDANCFAAGEKYFGQGKPFSNFVGITLGTGLGGGVVVDNHLYSGNNCCAGEIGSIPYLDSIFEDYCSGKFFRDKVGSEGKAVSEAAARGDATALEAMKAYGEHLAKLVQTLLFTYDPEAIILGGSIRKDFEFFSPALLEGLKSFPYQHCIERLTIRVSDLADSPVLGAAALYWDAQG